jgi:hypothetical protein
LFLLAGIAPVSVDLFAARSADIESFPATWLRELTH